MTMPDPYDAHDGLAPDAAAPGGGAAQNAARDEAGDETGAEEARHRRALVLSEVAADGAPGLSRVLRRAAAADRDAAAVPVTALVHAVPGMTALSGHELLMRAHIRETDLAGDLGPGQRVALVDLVSQTDRVRRLVG